MPALRRHVRAAGGLVVDDQRRVAVVHRPRYDDWSLPKGKLEAGESWEDAALREVEEECGLRCTLGEPLPSETYTDSKGRPKTVRWWRMTPVEDLGFTPDDEVDELRWLGRDEAMSLLSYAHDRSVVEHMDQPGARD